MTTIAISLDERTLQGIDRLAAELAKVGGRRNRSEVVRMAVAELLARRERAKADAEERKIWRKHRARLSAQGAALVRDQAKP